MKKSSLILAAVTAGALVMAANLPSALAASASTSPGITVSAGVLRTCTIQKVTDLAFGNYDPLGVNATADLTANSTIRVHCNRNTLADITISNGNNASGSQRRMASSTSSDFLNYNLQKPLADGTTNSNTAWDTYAYAQGSTAGVRDLTVFGVIPMAQNSAAAGDYLDTIVATITFTP